MKRTESQNKIIRDHLKKHKSISPLQALNKYGIYRLASRCYDLRNDPKDPLDIKTTMVFEHPIKFAKYHL